MAALLIGWKVAGVIRVRCSNPINKGGAVQRGKGMTAQAIYKMLMKRGAEAGVKSFSPHDFRRTVAGDMLDRNVDIVTVAKLAGHSDVKTTARYDRRPETTKRDAAGKLHYPYHRRSVTVKEFLDTSGKPPCQMHFSNR